jgi:nucleoside-diphosphate-sugar epimerase
MRLYGELKLDDERRFAQWAEAACRRAVIGRIYNLTGPYINKHEAYAIAGFILDGLAGRTAVVRAMRPVIRSYVAIRELMSLVFALLADEPQGIQRFDSGGEPMELAEVAGMVARVFPSSRVERAPLETAAPDRYHGDGEAYSALLAAFGITPVPLIDQIRETADFLKDAANAAQPKPGYLL